MSQKVNGPSKPSSEQDRNINKQRWRLPLKEAGREQPHEQQQDEHGQIRHLAAPLS